MLRALTFTGTLSFADGSSSAPSITFASATNTGMYLNGTGIGFATAGGLQFNVANTASAVNYYTTTGAVTLGAVISYASGSDTNIPAAISSKGTGGVALYTGQGARLQFNVADTASAVNYTAITGAALSGWPRMYTAGTDTDIPFGISSKGAGGVGLYTGSLASLQFYAANTTSAVNYLQATGAATTAHPSLAAAGSDTNINLKLSAKGTGALQVGTTGMMAANGAVATSLTGVGPTGASTTVQEWLKVVNSAGTTRYIPCF